MEFQGRAAPLGQDGFVRSADELAIDAAKLWAVMEVEARSCGYLTDRRPVILFERHKFHAQTDGRYDRLASEISNRVAGGYGRAGSAQYDKLYQAIRLDEDAALSSASWGLGQIMGFNSKLIGYQSVQDMVTAMCASEENQLRAMTDFILVNGLDKYLRVGDWASFARNYNGPKYHINQYDARLNGAHRKYSSGPLPDLKVREAQILLSYLGYSPGQIDGWFGKFTRAALNAWRTTHGRREVEVLTEDDVKGLWSDLTD